MSHNYLHHHKDYKDLISAVADEKGIAPDLIEKDYWIMHCLYALTLNGYRFELKGGTSLSKGFGIIHRFSEDIDIRIEPPDDLKVYTGKNNVKPQHCESRKAFYDQLANEILIDGIIEVSRDEVFDNPRYFSAGIRLAYDAINPISEGIKESILLEVGFDNVTPNRKVDISSWALDFAKTHNMEIINNTATNIACYDPGYTFVEKLQTIATKFRQQQETGGMPKNFMRHYYDIVCLLDDEGVQAFIGTPEYEAHKTSRFPKIDYNIPIAENEAFLLSDAVTRKLYEENYQATSALYYQIHRPFDQLMDKIHENIGRL